MSIIAMVVCLVGCEENQQVDRYTVTHSRAIANAPASHMTQPSVGAEQLPPAPSNSRYRWIAPDDWEAQELSSMRLGSYLIPVGDETGDLSVIQLAGTGGGRLNNLNRWREQVGLQTVEEDSPEAAGKTVSTSLGEIVYWKLAGETDEDPAMLAAMLFGDQHVLYIKLTGNTMMINTLEDQYAAFLSSFRFERGDQ